MNQNDNKVFTPSEVTLFMGGEFTLTERVNSTKDLIKELDSWKKELEGWGDEEIAEILLHENKFKITLTNGISS